MSDALDQGITVTQIQAMDEPVGVAAQTTAAFVGCAARGPLNTPVEINSVAAFRDRFGSTTSRGSLGPAVQQFFDHGGQRLFVVRVANNATGARLRLPTESGALTLRAVEPGAAERVRAAIDYDGCEDSESATFNLTVQRVSPASGLVRDQEIYSRVSLDPEHRHFIADALLGSGLVRAEHPLPADRPLCTGPSGSNLPAGYADPTQRGTDGDELSDYDLIGSASSQIGMFALNGVERFDILYLPPEGRKRDLGPAAVLAAELYARDRGAILILDPPCSWSTVEDAIDGVRSAGYASANILAYFPRMVLRANPAAEPLPVGAAIAGLLCKLDAQRGPWEDLDQPGFALLRALKPAMSVSPAEGAALVKEGLNTIAGSSASRAALCGSVTLARNAQVERQFIRLTVRRLCLRMTNSIERATRWAVFETGGPRTAERVRAQVHAYLSALADMGAFADDKFEVQCESVAHLGPLDPMRGVDILLAFRPVECDETISLTVHQTVQGCRVSSTAFAPTAAECA